MRKSGGSCIARHKHWTGTWKNLGTAAKKGYRYTKKNVKSTYKYEKRVLKRTSKSVKKR